VPVTAGVEVRAPVEGRGEEILSQEARALFDQVALGKTFAEFLTLPAYDHLD
jgi:hypothetical protein